MSVLILDDGINQASPVNAKIAAVLADRCASYWLKNALTAAIQRDPVDAMCDAELLAEILRARTGEVLS